MRLLERNNEERSIDMNFKKIEVFHNAVGDYLPYIYTFCIKGILT